MSEQSTITILKYCTEIPTLPFYAGVLHFHENKEIEEKKSLCQNKSQKQSNWRK
jgi:hypothetical protein